MSEKWFAGAREVEAIVKGDPEGLVVCRAGSRHEARRIAHQHNELVNENERLRRLLEAHRAAFRGFHAENERLERLVEAYRELGDWVDCDNTCRAHPYMKRNGEQPCTCGLAAARAAVVDIEAEGEE